MVGESGIHAYANMLAAAHELSERVLARLRQLHERFPADLPLKLVEDLGRSGSAAPVRPRPSGGPERRSSPRAAAHGIRVSLSEWGSPSELARSWVCDHSTRGLGIWLSRPVAPGSVLFVSSENAPAGAPCSLVEVRHCRPLDGGWSVGCRFLHLSPAQAALFGGEPPS